MSLRRLFVVPIAFSCSGCFSLNSFTGPLLECPESLSADEVATLTASKVDDALIWEIEQSDQTGATFILADGMEVKVATTSVEGDPGSSTGTTTIAIRASHTGTLQIRVTETMIGPPLSLPRPQGSDACAIRIQ